MTEHRKPTRETGAKDKLNGPDVSLEEKQRQLEGQRETGRQSGVLEKHHVEEPHKITPTAHYEAENEVAEEDEVAPVAEIPSLLGDEAERKGETSDAFEAAEEGLVYVPPVDPPTVPSDSFENAEVASGMEVSSLEEPYTREGHRSFLMDDDEINARVREALRADSRTSRYADDIGIETSDGIVMLHGVVVDLEDSDMLLSVAMQVEGVREVIDKMGFADEGFKLLQR